MRRLTPIAAAALLILAIGMPVNAAGPLVVGDDGLVRSGTYTAEVTPAWKVQLLALYRKQLAGTMSAADAAQWNAIIDAQGIDPTSQLAQATASSPGSVTTAYVAALDLTGTQVPQTKTYYCGPAAAQSVVLAWHNEKGYPTTSKLDGQSLSQAHLATSTYTNADTGSTDWVDNDMTKALNNWLDAGGVLYVQYTPTSVSALQDHVMLDTSLAWMIASDTIERANNSALHFNNHPIGIDIYHWTTIRGYASSGATFHLQDSAANTTVLGSSWDLVAPYFSMTSSKTYNLMTANGIANRGIAW